VSEHNSSDHTSVGLIDIASPVPGCWPIPGDRSVGGGHRAAGAADSKTSIGKGVPGPAPPAWATRCSSGSAISKVTYREANATANRYAAVHRARRCRPR